MSPIISVVTGGARGIGLATARALARRGRAVALLDLNDAEAQAQATQLSEEFGVRTLGLRVDVTSQASVDTAFTEVERSLGSVDILVNNAGLITPAYLAVEDLPLEDFERMIAVHVTGSFLCSARAMPAMKRNGYGRIMMISSLVGPLGFTNRVAYSTAKEGIVGMMRSLAVEAGPYGVTVNAIAPGWITSPIIEQRIRDGVLDGQALLARTPLGRFGTPDDIGNAIAALSGPDFDFLNGVEIPFDGGFKITGEQIEHARAAVA
ncbi:SDR family NAD(P)-dependent oxidoreductase [Humidisolicoccus flavus]|uniref:SDR family NAD(P)-dependent oxidoreductase n=1 Tax=Humidisolicoccus flavus TaxID=3111414 RepID=UPI0032568557